LAVTDSGSPTRTDVAGDALSGHFIASLRQTLPFDLAAVTAYADVVGGREADGNPIAGFDGQIAVIRRSQAATLATRNTKDFSETGIPLIDPWQETTR
jgi:toxin FitB